MSKREHFIYEMCAKNIFYHSYVLSFSALSSCFFLTTSTTIAYITIRTFAF